MARHQADRPAYSILISPDGQLILDEIENQLQKFNINPATQEKITFWGDNEPTQRFWSSLNQEGLFSSFKIIIVREANLWNNKIWQSIFNAIVPPKQDIWLFLCVNAEYERGKFKLPAHIQKSKCMEYAIKNKLIWSAPKLNGNLLKGYIENQAKKLNLSFAPNVLQTFCEFVLPDAAAITNEIKKFSFLAKDGIITEDLLTLDNSGKESDAFALIKKLENQNFVPAWIEINKSNANTLLFYLIALLAREFRTFWQLLTGDNPWIAPAELATKKRIALQIKKEGIASGFCALADAEWQVKSGKLSPEQALESLIIKINNLFNKNEQDIDS